MTVETGGRNVLAGNFGYHAPGGGDGGYLGSVDGQLGRVDGQGGNRGSKGADGDGDGGG